ncbi:MAG: hypothetical protein DME98_03990 [Verrucomicrobia bacterium]|nr:MAG: hypothetical protein DME98_03990 [Verrucomicrobiota bacterium]
MQSGSAATKGLPANHANRTHEREYPDWGFLTCAHTGTALRGGLPTKRSKKARKNAADFRVVSFV